MKITINQKKKSFTFEWEGVEQEVTFKEIIDSAAWKEHQTIQIIHKAKTEKEEEVATYLNRNAFTETMKEGDEEYHRHRGAWDLNTAIHKLYGLLDGKDHDELEKEIENISGHHTRMMLENREWNNSQVEKIALLEQQLNDESCGIGAEEIMGQIELLKQEQQPHHIPRALKRMYYAANDEKAPHIKLSNVNPKMVDDHYGDKLTII